MARPLCYLLLPMAVACSPRSASQLVEHGLYGPHQNPITSYTKALRRDSTHVEAYWRRGMEYAKRGQSQQAIADYTHAISIEQPFNAGYLFGCRGESFEALQQLPQVCQSSLPTGSVSCNSGRLRPGAGRLPRGLIRTRRRGRCGICRRCFLLRPVEIQTTGPHLLCLLGRGGTSPTTKGASLPYEVLRPCRWEVR